MQGDKALEQGRDTGAAEARNPSVLAYEAPAMPRLRRTATRVRVWPPLTRKGHDIWACGPHRADVERLLRGGAAPQTPSGRMQLL